MDLFQTLKWSKGIQIGLLFGLCLLGRDLAAPAAVGQEKDGRMSQNVPMARFFPLVSGSLAKASVELPAGYRIQKLPDDLALNNFLWGQQEDLNAALANPDQVAFDKTAHGIFRVRFSQNVTYDAQANRLVDVNGPVSLEEMGVQGTVTPLNTAAVRGLAIAGTRKGKPLRLAYLFSPADNLAVFISFHSPNPTASPDQETWDRFVKSLSR